MESKTSYTIVGVIVLLLAAALLSASLWLSMGFNQKTYSYYTVYLHEAASGLSEDSPVKFNGVKVGFVKTIKLNKTDPRQVEITLSIESGTPITSSTSATLISQGITGVTYVGLSASSSDLEPLQKMPGEPYPVIPAKPSLFNQLDSILKEVSDSVNKVSQQAQKVFNEENAAHLRSLLINMDTFTGVLAKNSDNIDSSLKSFKVILRNGEKASPDFPIITKRLKKGLLQFSSMAGSVKQAANEFSNQAIPPAVLLLEKLNGIASNLDKVSVTMRRNPSVIFRGTTPPPPGPGE